MRLKAILEEFLLYFKPHQIKLKIKDSLNCAIDKKTHFIVLAFLNIHIMILFYILFSVLNSKARKNNQNLFIRR